MVVNQNKTVVLGQSQYDKSFALNYPLCLVFFGVLLGVHCALKVVHVCTCNSKHKGKKSFLVDKMMFVEVNQFLLLDLLLLGW